MTTKSVFDFMDPRRLSSKVMILTRKHGVAQRNVTGAFNRSPLRETEYLLHEVAHWVTLGRDLAKLPRDLSRRIADEFAKISRTSQNSLELDTALLVYLTGLGLGLWDDFSPIAHSCLRNLHGIICLGQTDEVLKLFQERWDSEDREWAKASAKDLAKWLYPSAKFQLPENVRFVNPTPAGV